MTQFVAKTPIPINHIFDADLNPTNALIHRCCLTSTLLQYIGQWLNNILFWFPAYPDSKGLAVDNFMFHGILSYKLILEKFIHIILLLLLIVALYLAQNQYIRSFVRTEAVSTMKATVHIGYH